MTCLKAVVMTIPIPKAATHSKPESVPIQMNLNPNQKTTELVCPCGKRLSVMVPAKGWRICLISTALANRWKIEQSYEVEWGDTIDAYCPNCHNTRHLP